jgi:hypothetical protein
MEIRILVDAPKGWKRRVLMFVVTPLAIVATTAIVARATVQNVDTTWIQDGGPVSATSLTTDFATVNSNFGDLQGQVTTLQGQAAKPVVTINGKQWSVGAALCGQTAATQGLITGGYAGAKSLCQSACGGSASAHMCTTEELVRSVQAGMNITTNMWCAGGVYASPITLQGVTSTLSDCAGWTSNAQGQSALKWSNNAPEADTCISSYPIACCD